MTNVDRLSVLADARDLLIAAMTSTDEHAPPLPQVVRELRAVLAEIDKIPGSGEVTPLDRLADRVTDELAQRRADRGAAATGT